MPWGVPIVPVDPHDTNSDSDWKRDDWLGALRSGELLVAYRPQNWQCNYWFHFISGNTKWDEDMLFHDYGDVLIYAGWLKPGSYDGLIPVINLKNREFGLVAWSWVWPVKGTLRCVGDGKHRAANEVVWNEEEWAAMGVGYKVCAHRMHHGNNRTTTNYCVGSCEPMMYDKMRSPEFFPLVREICNMLVFSSYDASVTVACTQGRHRSLALWHFVGTLCGAVSMEYNNNSTPICQQRWDRHYPVSRPMLTWLYSEFFREGPYNGMRNAGRQRPPYLYPKQQKFRRPLTHSNEEILAPAEEGYNH